MYSSLLFFSLLFFTLPCSKKGIKNNVSFKPFIRPYSAITPTSAHQLAEKLAVSVRTIYRDIETLRLQGAHIEGEAGLGFVLRDGFVLPPLMFSIEELEAIVLGSRWVQTHADEKLVNAATQAIAKINSVIPKQHQNIIENNTIFTPSFTRQGYQQLIDTETAVLVRNAIRLEKVCNIHYADGKGDASQRQIYPFGLTFFDEVQVIMAWCCLRADFRHFRVDRIQSIELLQQTYQPNKHSLLKDWQHKECIDLAIVQNF